jgi:hypothetical protein
LVIVWGLAAVAFLGWCQHRASFSVLFRDPAWPRSWPYPDAWLARWYDRIDAEHPVPPGHVKLCGEWYRLQSRLRAYTLSACGVVALGMAIVLWPNDRLSSRQHSVRRGVAIGLLIGVLWASVVAHLNDDGSPPEWMLLAIYALGFAITGVAVGAVRRCRELVGLAVGNLTVVVLVQAVARHKDGLLCGFKYECITMNLLAALEPGVDWHFCWPMVFGICGSLGGILIGGIHRLVCPAGKGEAVAAEGRGHHWGPS